ncbi:hypothetical protein GCM10017044_11030 [Kordiimonas sediminis]|uniref:NADH-quinone oxidoreductase subunit J n=1 Tax=Kordiimonas sediminis TaxID=1735581 RepID=A0A919APQ6_9PROT|nr:hypothetical protein [Kordiimonas sediminis]GHF18305.1 hypothetical protein GCM10017044_11030 [Kordiimonas sediminis]
MAYLIKLWSATIALTAVYSSAVLAAVAEDTASASAASETSIGTASQGWFNNFVGFETGLLLIGGIALIFLIQRKLPTEEDMYS